MRIVVTPDTQIIICETDDKSKTTIQLNEHVELLITDGQLASLYQQIGIYLTHTRQIKV